MFCDGGSTILQNYGGCLLICANHLSEEANPRSNGLFLRRCALLPHWNSSVHRRYHMKNFYICIRFFINSHHTRIYLPPLDSYVICTKMSMKKSLSWMVLLFIAHSHYFVICECTSQFSLSCEGCLHLFVTESLLPEVLALPLYSSSDFTLNSKVMVTPSGLN
jgi:hypothetical protein